MFVYQPLHSPLSGGQTHDSKPSRSMNPRAGNLFPKINDTPLPLEFRARSRQVIAKPPRAALAPSLPKRVSSSGISQVDNRPPHQTIRRSRSEQNRTSAAPLGVKEEI